ncbi:MAG TPA: type II toxin-antitoxin system HicA family toxin, partial [Methanothrix sp.]
KAERVFAVPLHEELKKGTLNAILKQAGLETEDLQK